MKQLPVLSSRFSVVLIAIALAVTLSSAQVLRVAVDDAIQPVTSEYIARALQNASAHHDQAVLIKINTPGGLVESTRDIIEKIVASPVPVIIYVTPSGSRAASAGFFILESPTPEPRIP
jgi:membrane-bound serine protease (ClpP class)